MHPAKKLVSYRCSFVFCPVFSCKWASLFFFFSFVPFFFYLTYICLLLEILVSTQAPAFQVSYHADSFFSFDMCHADRPKARTCFYLWRLSLALSLWVGDALRWRWGAVPCCWEPRPGWLLPFESQNIPDLGLGELTGLNERKRGVDLLIEMPKIARERLNYGGCVLIVYILAFFCGGLIYKQWSWTSQESRWDEEFKNHWLRMYWTYIKGYFWEIWPFYWILMVQAWSLSIFWTAPGACSLTPTVFCISIGFCAPFRSSLKHYINNYRVNTGICNGAFNLKRLLDSCK